MGLFNFKKINKRFNIKKINRMEKFIIQTEVTVIKTLEYHVEASSLKEAIEIVRTGEVRGEGETIDELDDWSSEQITIEEE